MKKKEIFRINFLYLLDRDNLTNEQIAEKVAAETGVNVNPSTVTRWRSGHVPNLESLCALGHIFGVSLDELCNTVMNTDFLKNISNIIAEGGSKVYPVLSDDDYMHTPYFPHDPEVIEKFNAVRYMEKHEIVSPQELFRLKTELLEDDWLLKGLRTEVIAALLQDGAKKNLDDIKTHIEKLKDEDYVDAYDFCPDGVYFNDEEFCPSNLWYYDIRFKSTVEDPENFPANLCLNKDFEYYYAKDLADYYSCLADYMAAAGPKDKQKALDKMCALASKNNMYAVGYLMHILELGDISYGEAVKKKLDKDKQWLLNALIGRIDTIVNNAANLKWERNWLVDKEVKDFKQNMKLSIDVSVEILNKRLVENCSKLFTIDEFIQVCLDPSKVELNKVKQDFDSDLEHVKSVIRDMYKDEPFTFADGQNALLGGLKKIVIIKRKR